MTGLDLFCCLTIGYMLLWVITLPAFIEMLEYCSFEPFIHHKNFIQKWKNDLNTAGLVIALTALSIILLPAMISATIVRIIVWIGQSLINLYFWVFRKRNK